MRSVLGIILLLVIVNKIVIQIVVNKYSRQVAIVAFAIAADDPAVILVGLLDGEKEDDVNNKDKLRCETAKGFKRS